MLCKDNKFPFHITGKFTNLNYNLDVASLLQSMAKQQAKNQLQNTIKNNLGDSPLGQQGQKLLSGLLGQ